MDAASTLEQGQSSEKAQKWQHVEKEVNEIEKKDPHGIKIDPSIRRTVIALNVMGIDTAMSCEGHLDHERGAPYVDTSRGAAQMRIAADNAYIAQRHVDYERMKAKSIEINTKIYERVQNYLEDFYADRDVPQHARLVADFNPYGSIRLRNQGAAIQNDANPDEKSANLKAFQSEMEEFGSYLENKFFND